MRALISFAAWALRLARLRTCPPPRQNHGPVHPHARLQQRIQREDISLEGNTVDNANNVGIFFELSAISCIVFTTPSTTCRHAGRYRRHFAPVARPGGRIGVLLHCRGELLHAGGSFFHADACCSVREERSVLPAAISRYRHRWHLNLRAHE